MGSKKLNNVLNLLIEEIKDKEKVTTNKESKSSKRRGADIARSILNEDSNISNNFFFSTKEGKKNYIDKNSSKSSSKNNGKNSSEGNHFGIKVNHKREELEDPLNKNDESRFNHKENERRRIISSSNSSGHSNRSNKDNNDIDQEDKGREEEEKKEKENEQRKDEDGDEGADEDEEENCSLTESEKQVLHFYDPTIDDYDEEYVTRKYRFMATDCDSSLCCCGCFTPVCYKSERHPTYVNQYKSLYAVSVAIEKERILKAKEINMKKVTQQINDTDGNSSCNSNSCNSNIDENIFSETESDEEKEEKEEKGKEVIYEHLNQANKTEATLQTKNKIRKKKEKKEKMTKYTYYPVFCANCNNHLAYYEIETKIFHFFDVLPD